MHHSNIKTSQHDWEKKNLVTIGKRGRMYDEVVCKNCGMKGRRYDFESVEISENYKSKNVYLCPKAKPAEIPKRIKITICNAFGKAFSNLSSGSIHDVVTPPKGYKNDHTGVWVMGVGEPVKLVTGEFVSIN